MARILVNDVWFEALASTAFLEQEYENLILSRAYNLFPEFRPVPFRKLIQSETGSRRPDFALIDRSYGSWWVVEVELAHHSFYGHVFPQVSVFTDAVYGAEDASYLHFQDPSLDLDALKEMMRGEHPRTLVVVNAPSPSWQTPLKSIGVTLSIAEVFRSPVGKHVIRLNGDYPRILNDEGVLSLCHFSRTIPDYLTVASPARLPSTDDNRYWIEYEGSSTEWVRVPIASDVWLSPSRGINPLPRDADRIELLQIEEKRLMFRLIGP